MREKSEKILIIDFGSQYTHLIARRIRELGVYSEIVPYSVGFSIEDVKGVILSGGPMSFYDKDAPSISREKIEYIVDSGIPILGICYGHQLLAKLSGGEVVESEKGEYGPAELIVLYKRSIMRGLPDRITVWMSHRDVVKKMPKSFRILAKTPTCPIAAFESSDEMIYGVQFHPEVHHTEYGLKILENFIEICGFSRKWIIADIIDSKVREIQDIVGDSRVLIATSGGVDSITAAKLIQRAIGDRLHVVFINTGFLRDGEPEKVLTVLKDLGFKNIHYLDESEKFINALLGVSDPEEKRQKFSRIYAKVLDDFARKLKEKYPQLKFFAQGTIYPDRVESGAVGTGTSRIKSHHNVVMPTISGLIKLEPLADLYKDEVRKIAKELGIPREVYMQHPFPGPGLLIRVVGRVTLEKLEICRKVHKIVEEEARKYGIYEDLWQIFPVVLDSRATGIKGDERAYGYIIVLRAVRSQDGMTADFAKLPWELLEKISQRITSEIKEVCRVVYDITHKPPATIEFE